MSSHLFFFFLLFSSLKVSFVAARDLKGAKENHFTPDAILEQEDQHQSTGISLSSLKGVVPIKGCRRREFRQTRDDSKQQSAPFTPPSDKRTVTFVAARELKGTKENPSTPKAHLKRYWSMKISNNLPESLFLHSKASSELKADIANFAKLATAQNNNQLVQLPSLFPPSTFNIYGPYEDYFKNDINFINYSSNSEIKIKNNNKSLEAGRFFRESNLKKGTVMPMPDITNKMPESTFLPRTTVNKIPFSSTELSAMKEIFNASDNSAMERIIKEALKDCERKPNKGESKRCVASAEDMIDFSTSVLGRDVALRKTENNKGSKQDILIGSVNRINGGKVTKAVSCHQKLYPYLLYYCHSVPDVAVYEADILDPKTKKKINHGVAICHLDTSSWSAGHEAFHALGSGPGQIEVCHWIFEKDLIWTNSDH